MKMDNNALGNVIKLKRKKNKLSLLELSEKTGMSKSYIDLIEKGQREPSAYHLLMLSIILNIPMEVLMKLKMVMSLYKAIEEYKDYNKSEEAKLLQMTLENMIKDITPEYIVTDNDTLEVISYMNNLDDSQKKVVKQLIQTVYPKTA